MCKQIDTLRREETKESKRFWELMQSGRTLTINDHLARAERRQWYEEELKLCQDKIKQLETP